MFVHMLPQSFVLSSSIAVIGKCARSDLLNMFSYAIFASCTTLEENLIECTIVMQRNRGYGAVT